MEITIRRDQVLCCEERLLSAPVYNLALGLYSRHHAPVFVPIRSMQFLAILDREEFVFVDHLDKQQAVMVWTNFKSTLREALDQPVPYRVLHYRRDSPQLFSRLQGEFHLALKACHGLEPHPPSARILPFP